MSIAFADIFAFFHAKKRPAVRSAFSGADVPYTSAAPSARQAACASSSGASLQITLSQASAIPFAAQSASQLRILALVDLVLLSACFDNCKHEKHLTFIMTR